MRSCVCFNALPTNVSFLHGSLDASAAATASTIDAAKLMICSLIDSKFKECDSLDHSEIFQWVVSGLKRDLVKCEKDIVALRIEELEKGE